MVKENIWCLNIDIWGQIPTFERIHVYQLHKTFKNMHFISISVKCKSHLGRNPAKRNVKLGQIYKVYIYF